MLFKRYWDILLHSINLDPPDEFLNEEDLNKSTSFLRIDRFNNNHFDPGLQELRLKIWKHFGYLLEKCGNGYIVQDLGSVQRHEAILQVFCGTRGHEAVLHCLQHCLSTANQPLPFLARVHEGWRALVEHSVSTLETALEHDKVMQKEQDNKESSVALTALLNDTASLLFAGDDEYGNVRCLLTGLEEEVMEYATFVSGHHGARRMAKSFQDMKEVVDLTLSLTRDMIDFSRQVFSSLINSHKEPPHSASSSSSLKRQQYRIEAEKRRLFACKRVQSIRREVSSFDSISSPQDGSTEAVDLERQLMLDWLDCWVSAKRASEQEISSIKLNHKEYARRFHDIAILYGGTHQQHRCGAGLLLDRYFQEIAILQETNSKTSPSHRPMTRRALQALLDEAQECRKRAKEQEIKIKAEIERSFLKR